LRRSKKDLFSFAELVDRSGVPRSSCQYYVTVGLVPKCGENERGWTLYNDESVRMVKMVRELTTSGFCISEIREIRNRFRFDTIESRFHNLPIEDFRAWLRSKGINLKH